ncbi:hypothetical protein DERF_005366 [Dermatophagoides farinae]|uniref:Uncharacterized protein n=1 Tax=Dermatophagoides farinae TaxID=6954 RepID=A0A922I3V9_DERFA|nr:hypothetical protein DERF_005366 [Dermatophagoides farinae]
MSSPSSSSVPSNTVTNVIASNSNNNDDDDLKHPLFHLAIVNRLKEKIPLINRIIIYVEDNYARIKSGTGMLSIVMGQVEQGINSMAINIVHYVPRKPVEMIDKMACNGVEIVDKRLRQMFDLSIIIRDNVVAIPMVIWKQCSELMTVDGFYGKLDQFLSSLEMKLEYWMPLPEPHQNVQDQESTKKMFARLWIFVKHLNEHLKHYAKGHFFIIRLIAIMDRFKPNFITNGTLISPPKSLKSDDQKVIKPDVAMEKLSSTMEKMVETISNNPNLSKSIGGDQQQQQQQQQQKSTATTTISTDDIVEQKKIQQFKDQVTAAVDQIISNDMMKVMDKKIDNNQKIMNNHMNGQNGDVNKVPNSIDHQQQQQQQQQESIIKENHNDNEKVNGEQQKLQQQQREQGTTNQMKNKVTPPSSSSVNNPSSKIQSTKSTKSSKKSTSSSSANGF